ncbi:MAG: HNH endonuclease [SAR324 cluster bacterium]|nr:HNH endonuclease [SAR324 cluster bacterium]
MSNERVPAELRRIVMDRAQGCCEYCHSQSKFATQSFSVEHIIPVNKGGNSELGNLALACQGCNNHKYTRTEGTDPVGHQIVLLFHPRQHQWNEHFVWNHDCTLMIGLTPTGRTTIDILRLNRPGLVNLRKILYETGEHPPLMH